jgi:hypothetical protein
MHQNQEQKQAQQQQQQQQQQQSKRSRRSPPVSESVAEMHSSHYAPADFIDALGLDVAQVETADSGPPQQQLQQQQDAEDLQERELLSFLSDGTFM